MYLQQLTEAAENDWSENRHFACVFSLQAGAAFPQRFPQSAAGKSRCF
jgi:hypothetical protein